MRHACRRRRQILIRCTLCGREVPAGGEYWACNGHRVCGNCLPEFARRELAPYREIAGEEARQ